MSDLLKDENVKSLTDCHVFLTALFSATITSASSSIDTSDTQLALVFALAKQLATTSLPQATIDTPLLERYFRTFVAGCYLPPIATMIDLSCEQEKAILHPSDTEQQLASLRHDHCCLEFKNEAHLAARKSFRQEIKLLQRLISNNAVMQPLRHRKLAS